MGFGYSVIWCTFHKFNRRTNTIDHAFNISRNELHYICFSLFWIRAVLWGEHLFFFSFWWLDDFHDMHSTILTLTASNSKYSETISARYHNNRVGDYFIHKALALMSRNNISKKLNINKNVYRLLQWYVSIAFSSLRTQPEVVRFFVLNKSRYCSHYNPKISASHSLYFDSNSIKCIYFRYTNFGFLVYFHNSLIPSVTLFFFAPGDKIKSNLEV